MLEKKVMNIFYLSKQPIESGSISLPTKMVYQNLTQMKIFLLYLGRRGPLYDYHFMFKCGILLISVLGEWTVVCVWQYRPWTGSIKPSMQHIQFCRVGLSLGIRIFSICKKKCLSHDSLLVILHWLK
jgi:hypothetical protein